MEKMKRERGRPEKLTYRFEKFITNQQAYHPNLSAAAIRERLRNALYAELQRKNESESYKMLMHKVDNLVPGLSTVQKCLKKNKANWPKPSPLDNPWSLGSCLGKDISVDVIVPIQQQLLNYGRYLTIRRARWYSMLHPVLFPLLEKAYPGQLDQNQIRLHQIASFYTRIEQIAEISRETYLDTRVLDNTFIFNQDFSPETSIRLWMDLYLHIPALPSKVTDSPPPGEKAEQILGKNVAAEDVKLLNEFIENMNAYEAGVGDLEKAISLVHENPNIQPLVEKWMALSLRRDIKISPKEGVK